MTAGIDEPDHRGRTGLDRAGHDLTRNPDIVVRDVELLASGWHVLRRTTYDHRHRTGRSSKPRRTAPGTRTGPGGGVAADGEDIEAVELPFAEALAMTADGQIADAKTIMLVQWAALRGPFRELHDSAVRGVPQIVG